MPQYNYAAAAHWTGNDKKPKQIGEEFLSMIKLFDKTYLIPNGAKGSKWNVADINDPYKGAPLSNYLSNFENYVEHKMCIYEGEPDPMGGYRIFSELEIRPLKVAKLGTLSFYLCDGSPVMNEFEFEIGGAILRPDPSRVSFSFYKEALLGGLSIWPSDWANVRCVLQGASPAEACGDPTFPYSHYQMPWMSYLSAERAAKVSVPAGIVTERTPDGGLLMIAAETRLDPQDREQMKRSRVLAELMIEHAGKR